MTRDRCKRDDERQGTGCEKRHPVHTSIIDGINVDCFAGYYVGAQWDEVMENAMLGPGESHLFQREAECSCACAGDQLHYKQDHHHSCGGRKPLPILRETNSSWTYGRAVAGSR
jgi:hypothetical protein